MARILIADDSVVARRNLRSILTKAGHTVVAEAGNGIEAFNEYAAHLPDLVTMDITMPVMDGIDAVKRIIKRYPQALIIVISALDQKMMVMNAITNGARHYIIKPYSPEKVLSSIDAVLTNARKSNSAQ